MYNLNTDENGAIGQIQADDSIEMGDSANWTGHFIYLTGSKKPSISYFERGYGGYVRHPNKELTTNGHGAYLDGPYMGCMSRDQLTGVVCALIKERDYKANMRFIFNHSLKLFLFAYNTIKNGDNPETAKSKLPDVTFMDFWALECRMFGIFSWLLFPLMCILDIHTLISVLIFNKFEEDDDVISLAMKVIVPYEKYPTPVSKLTYRLLDHKKMKEKIHSYWTTWRDNEDMHKAYNLHFKGRLK